MPNLINEVIRIIDRVVSDRALKDIDAVGLQNSTNLEERAVGTIFVNLDLVITDYLEPTAGLSRLFNDVPSLFDPKQRLAWLGQMIEIAKCITPEEVESNEIKNISSAGHLLAGWIKDLDQLAIGECLDENGRVKPELRRALRIDEVKSKVQDQQRAEDVEKKLSAAIMNGWMTNLAGSILPTLAELKSEAEPDLAKKITLFMETFSKVINNRNTSIMDDFYRKNEKRLHVSFIQSLIDQKLKVRADEEDDWVLAEVSPYLKSALENVKKCVKNIITDVELIKNLTTLYHEALTNDNEAAVVLEKILLKLKLPKKTLKAIKVTVHASPLGIVIGLIEASVGHLPLREVNYERMEANLDHAEERAIGRCFRRLVESVDQPGALSRLFQNFKSNDFIDPLIKSGWVDKLKSIFKKITPHDIEEIENTYQFKSGVSYIEEIQKLALEVYELAVADVLGLDGNIRVDLYKALKIDEVKLLKIGVDIYEKALDTDEIKVLLSNPPISLTAFNAKLKEYIIAAWITDLTFGHATNMLAGEVLNDPDYLNKMVCIQKILQDFNQAGSEEIKFRKNRVVEQYLLKQRIKLLEIRNRIMKLEKSHIIPLPYLADAKFMLDSYAENEISHSEMLQNLKRAYHIAASTKPDTILFYTPKLTPAAALLEKIIVEDFADVLFESEQQVAWTRSLRPG